MDRKFGDSVPFLGRESGVSNSPSNTESPGPRSTSIPSGILIHAAIWPHQIWAENWGAVTAVPHSAPTLQTDRQTGQWSDSIWRTVLQTVTQKQQYTLQ